MGNNSLGMYLLCKYQFLVVGYSVQIIEITEFQCVLESGTGFLVTQIANARFRERTRF